MGKYSWKTSRAEELKKEKVNMNKVLLEKTIKLTRLLAFSTCHPPLIYRCTHHRIYIKAACKPF